MHEASMRMMTEALRRYAGTGRADVLDVGSLDVNGSYRELVGSRDWNYTGLDVVAGKNVDVVTLDPYQYPFDYGEFDIVIAGNMLHNVPYPDKLIWELARVLKTDGLLVIVTVWKLGINAYPKDYFRFMPDGLRLLFDDTHRLNDCKITMDDDGTITGSAFKYV